MPRLLTAKEIASEALKHIGAYGVNDTGPDPAQLDRALGAFDMLVQELAGSEPILWLRPLEVAITLVDGQAEYDLMTELGGDYPADWIEHPTGAVLVDSNGYRRPVTMIRRDHYLAKQDLTSSGPPSEVYIDRIAPHLTLYTYPVIATSGYTLRLAFQTYANDLLDEKTGAEAHRIPAAWQRWGKLATAYDISAGSVLSLSLAERANILRDAEAAKRDLLAFNNRDRGARGYTKPRDF